MADDDEPVKEPRFRVRFNVSNATLSLLFGIFTFLFGCYSVWQWSISKAIADRDLVRDVRDLKEAVFGDARQEIGLVKTVEGQKRRVDGIGKTIDENILQRLDKVESTVDKIGKK